MSCYESQHLQFAGCGNLQLCKKDTLFLEFKSHCGSQLHKKALIFRLGLALQGNLINGSLFITKAQVPRRSCRIFTEKQEEELWVQRSKPKRSWFSAFDTSHATAELTDHSENE